MYYDTNKSTEYITLKECHKMNELCRKLVISVVPIIVQFVLEKSLKKN